MNVGKMLLDDRRAALMRQVERAVAGGGVLAAFAWYWLPKSPGMEIDIGPIIAGAVSAKGASRTFREVAVLGYAIAAGKTDADVIAAFNSGTAQMAGRDFDVVGTRAPVCNDCAALLGLSLGAARLRNESVKQWLTEACRLSTTRQNISVCDRSLLDLATALLSDQPVSPPKHSPLLLATHARGLLPPGAESESAAVSFLKMLPSRFDLTDEEAVLCLAALEWLLRSAPAVEIGAPSIRAVRDVLARSGASLHRWVIEDQPKTQGNRALHRRCQQAEAALPDAEKIAAGELSGGNFARGLLAVEVQRLQDRLAAAERERDGMREAIAPFVACVRESSGRIPTERLSFAHWHRLAALAAGREQPQAQPAAEAGEK
jgi:hypothetical protein